jgi:hypothetical protein
MVITYVSYSGESKFDSQVYRYLNHCVVLFLLLVDDAVSASDCA